MTLHHPWIVGPLLVASVALCLLCSIGVLVMRDAYQRLHFTTPVAAVVSFLIALAVWTEDSGPQPRVKIVLVVITLTAMNSVLCHVTARAIRLRDAGHWPVEAGEAIVDVAARPQEASS